MDDIELTKLIVWLHGKIAGAHERMNAYLIEKDFVGTAYYEGREYAYQRMLESVENGNYGD